MEANVHDSRVDSLRLLVEAQRIVIETGALAADALSEAAINLLRIELDDIHSDLAGSKVKE